MDEEYPKNQCPPDFPYAYRPKKNFDYCCATAADNRGNAEINAGPRSSRSDNCKDGKP